jgi:undecaprenyl-diphosphatase
VVILLLAAGWLVARRHGPAVMAAAIWAPVGTLLGVLAARVAARALDWPLPETHHHHVLLLVHRTSEGSPSVHTTLAASAACGLYLVRPRLGLAMGLIAVIIGLAQVYVGLHYPSDTLGGLVLGAVVSGTGFVMVKGLLVLLVTRLRTSALRPLVVAG